MRLNSDTDRQVQRCAFTIGTFFAPRVFLRRPGWAEQSPVSRVLKRCLDQPVSEQFEEQRSAVFGPDVLRQQLQGTRDGRLL